MPEESIVFAPEIDERDLDREVDEVNEALAEAGEDVPVDFESGDMDSLTPAGDDGIGGDAGGGGLGPGAGAAGASLASKIPKPVAAVSAGAAAALPVALAGGAAVGMLSAMQNASSRLQTSKDIAQSAWRDVWAPLGDRLDELFIRDLVLDIKDNTAAFRNLFREGKEGKAFWKLLGGEDKGFEQFQKNVRKEQTDSDVQTMFGDIQKDIFDDIFQNIGSNIAASFPGWKGEIIDLFPNWIANSPGIIDPFPGWGDIVDEFPGWPKKSDILSQFPTITREQFFDWITGTGNGDGDTTGDTTTDVPDETTITNPDFVVDMPEDDTGTDDTTGNGGGGGGGGGGGPFGGPRMEAPSAQTGGRITRSGIAEVHRGELVTDPERLVSELADAVTTATGGGRTVDTSPMERKLDELNRNLQALRRELAVSVEIGDETVARASAKGRRNRLGDTDPTV